MIQKNIANIITAIHIILLPFIIWSQQVGTTESLMWCLVLVCLGEITDFLDGQVARRLGQVSTFGKLFDPLADAITRGGIFLAFTASGWMPLWMCVIIISRDHIVAFTRMCAALSGIAISARDSGKTKGWLQGIVQISVVLGYLLEHHLNAYGAASAASYWLLALATVWTAWSCVDYVVAGIQSSVFSR